MKLFNKILIALGATAIIGGGLVGADIYLGADDVVYKEVPIVETKIKDEYRAYYQNEKDSKDIIDRELTREEYESMNANTPSNLQIKGYKFIYAYGGRPIVATSAPALKDNEFYKLATSTDEIMIKRPNEEIKKSTIDEVKVKKTGFRLIKEVNAAIVQDAVTNGGNSGSVTSWTYAHTCSGDDRILLASTVIVYSTERITGITYNGDAMAQGRKILNLDNRWQYIYGLIAPDTGTHNIVVSVSSATTIAYNKAVSYTGVLQSGFPNDSDGNTFQSMSSPMTLTVTPTVANAAIIAYFYSSTSADGAVAAGMSAVNGAGTGVILAQSNPLSISASGDYSVQFTDSAGFRDTIIAVAIAPVAGEPPAATPAVPNNNIIYFGE